MVNHGVNVSEVETSVSTPNVATSGIPYVVGTAPVHTAESPCEVNSPVLCQSWSEAVEQLGYSDNWTKYTLCEFMYSHFKLYACQPVIFCNVLDLTKAGAVNASTTETLDVTSHKVYLTEDAINDDTLVVASGDGTTYVSGTDYEAFYDDGSLVIELLSDGAAYSATSLSVSYTSVADDTVTDTEIAEGLEAIEHCLLETSYIPDLICAPGFSHSSTIAALMAAKAASINGLFRGKAIIDIQGATKYSEVPSIKSSLNMTDSEQIVCWPPIAPLGDYKFHMSTQVAGRLASTDTDNDGVPYETPSNKNLNCDCLELEDGTSVKMTLANANYLNDNGIETALYFINGWVCWGNHTAAYPSNTDVKDNRIEVSRMFKWVGNSLMQTFWSKVDNPLNTRLVNTILDSCNIWLNSLVSSGYLLGARAEVLDDENSTTDLMAGILTVHVYMTPPSAAEEIDFVLEYDTDYVSAALS